MVEKFGKGIAAGAGAVIVSGEVNEQVKSRYGLWWSAGVCAPIVEEVTKTSFADMLGGDVTMSHAMFGAIEGQLYGEERGQVKAFDYYRPILHASFGVAHMVGRSYRGKAAGYIAAILAHFVWNQYQILKWNYQHRDEPDKVIRASYEETQKREFKDWKEIKQKLVI